MTIKDKFKEFQTKHAATLAKVGIKLSGIEEATKVAMVATGELEDGTKVASPADNFSEGAELFVIDADGNETPAPDGDHRLNDGTLITTLDGKITAVVDVEVEEEMSADEIASNLEELGTKLSSALAENETLKAELEALKADKVTQSTEVTNLKSEVAKLKKQPAVTSVKQTSATETVKPQFTKPLSLAEKILQGIQTSTKN